MPVLMAYGENCLRANAHPWWALVGNTAMLGGLDQAADWWQNMVRDTCRHLGKSLDEFNREVAEEIAEAAKQEGVDDFSVCTCNAEDETKCSRCGQCSRCHGLCDCEIHPGTRCADCEADEDHCSCEDGFNPTSTGGDE